MIDFGVILVCKWGI